MVEHSDNLPDTTCETTLISDLIANKKPVIDSFVRANAGWMLVVARRYLKSEALAEDCVQDSFISIFVSVGSGLRPRFRFQRDGWGLRRRR